MTPTTAVSRRASRGDAGAGPSQRGPSKARRDGRDPDAPFDPFFEFLA